MKIQRVEPILVRMPLRLEGDVPKSSGAPKSDIYTLLVKIETDAGVTGWGEAFSNGGWMATRAAIEHVVGPRLVGRDPAQIPQIMHDLNRGLYNCGRSGAVYFAISGVDIALWDIAGKVAGLPLHRLLGGAVRASLPAYASLLRYDKADAVARYVEQALARGYRLIKLHEHVPAIVTAARKAAGAGVPIMVDCSCPWTVDEAIAMARRMESLDLTWLEEPIYPPDDHTALARLRAQSPIPIAAGENVSNLFEFVRLFGVQAVGVGQPSVTKMGGVSELRKVFALGEAHGVTIVPHSPYFGPGLAASVHVCSVQPRETWIERYYCDFDDNPFGATIHPVKGEIVVPQGPGLGMDPDESLITKLRVA